MRRRRTCRWPAFRGCGADAAHLVGGQDVLLYRMEGGLGERPTGPRLRRTAGQTVPDLRERCTVRTRHRRRVRTAGLVLRQLPRPLQAKRDQLAAGLADAGFRVLPPEGTYFVTADITPLRGGPYQARDTDGVAFCSASGACGVVAIPTQVFYDDMEAGRPLIRFAFCKRPEVIAEAVDRLQSPCGVLINGRPRSPRRPRRGPATRPAPPWAPQP